MDLFTRTRYQRLLIAPAHFLRLLRIGKGQLSLALRLRVALHLTWILLTHD